MSSTPARSLEAQSQAIDHRNRASSGSGGLGRWGVLVVLGASWLALTSGSVGAAQATLATGSGDRLAADPQARPATAKPPNDPLFRHQWHLPATEVPPAWGISRGAGATVAVLDTGVAYSNRGPYRRAPDLARTRFAAGWDFVDDDPYPYDLPPPRGRRSHGTHIAGIIAQTTGNAIGGAGVAPAAAIMPVRVLKPDRRGSGKAIARGLRFAADHGADVANLSIAGPSSTRVVARAVDYAAARGVTVVAAAGNDGRPSVSWPAAYPKVVAVGAVAQDLRRAPYSNYGRPLDLVAPAGAFVDTGYGPGDGVPAQTLKGGPSEFCFCFMASTSAAAAQVSGVAALLVGSGRARSPAETRAALLSSARDLGPKGHDPEHGAGLVQARRALSLARLVSAPVQTRTLARGPAPSGPGWLAPSIAGAGLVGLAGLVLVTRRRRANPA